MRTETIIHRLRSYFVDHGMNPRQVALAAAVHWRTAEGLLSGKGNLTLDSLRKLEAVVPADYEPSAAAGEEHLDASGAASREPGGVSE